MISSTNLISFYFIRDTGMASSQPSGNLSNSFPDGIPVGNLIPLMRREFPMGSHNLLFGYRFLSYSDPKLNLEAGVMATNYPAASYSVKGRSSDLLEKFGSDRNLAGEWTTVS